jgi:hypothetical protein
MTIVNLGISSFCLKAVGAERSRGNDTRTIDVSILVFRFHSH